jgi:hypothetical protein
LAVERKRRQPSEPWKGIYGKDRKYTARVDRAREREAAAVWAKLEADPEFNEAMRRGEADLAAGRGTPFREIRREAS